MARELPVQPVTSTDALLAHACGLLGEIADHLAGQAPQAPKGTELVTEPAKPPVKSAAKPKGTAAKR